MKQVSMERHDLAEEILIYSTEDRALKSRAVSEIVMQRLRHFSIYELSTSRRNVLQ